MAAVCSVPVQAQNEHTTYREPRARRERLPDHLRAFVFLAAVSCGYNGDILTRYMKRTRTKVDWSASIGSLKARPEQINLKDAVDIVLKVGGIGLVVGYVVVHGHLAGVSYYSSDIYTSTYISAAIWALIPLVVSTIFLVKVAVPFATKCFYGPLLKRLAVGVISLLGYIVVLGVSFALVFYPKSEWIQRQGTLDRLTLMAVFGCLVVSIPLGILYQSRKRLSGIGFAGLISDTPFFALAFYALLYVGLFTTYAYPAIPLALGGGKPHLVRLIIEKSARDALGRLDLAFDADGENTLQCRMVLMTPKTYVLLADGKTTAFELRRDVVQAVIHSPDG